MKILFATLIVVLAATLQLGFSNNSESWEKKIGVSLRHQQLQSSVDILVILKERADLSRADNLLTKLEKGRMVFSSLQSVASRSQKDLIQYLESRGVSYQSFYIINAVAVRSATRELIREMANRSDVRKIIADPVIRQNDVVDQIHGPSSESSGAGAGENIVSTGAEAVWKMGFSGEGIVVAGQDTGVAWKHPALINHYRGQSRGGVSHVGNWHDSIRTAIATGTNRCGLNLSEPCDDYDHGTHTMGTMIGNDGAGNAIGMAPGSKWIACRNMDAGYGRPTTYIECYQWLLAPNNDPALAPHVINNSWGCPDTEGCEGAEIKPVIEAIYKAGIMNVVSAGNDGPGCGTILAQPATVSDFTLSVGAHNHRDNKIADFSSRGPSALDGKLGPDITGPGVSIRSSVPNGTYEDAFWSGTSMAGPHIAGAVALLWSAQPKLVGNIQKTVDILRSTATATTSTETCNGVSGTAIPNNTYGYGRLNVEAAVKKALSL